MKIEFTWGLRGALLSRTDDASAINIYHVFAGNECSRTTIFLKFS
ncbi:MAG: hypothetical protein A4E65_02994 [Syntrophorhabdus sp. PtaU1.Bin153]|nr:MAG: hypothetical protein A4E65_02994 [Syntrophorhabdus sp. PtaU1.Bin153]